MLHFIIMEPPPRLLWWSAIPTVLHVAIIICWELLQKESQGKSLDDSKASYYAYSEFK